MILGLTGGMGCGKSTAAGLFSNHGFRTLDSDAIVRDTVLQEPGIVAAIREHFGREVLAEDGGVDRRSLARRVFAAEPERLWLEALLHPRVQAHWRAAFSADSSASWVVEVPLLFEKSLQNWFDLTICVTSHPSLQLVRLEQRGLSPPLAQQRISQQLPLAQKIELVDFVLLNDGSLAFLRDEVARLVLVLQSI
jgi:dephospho-CoA kinase